MRSIGFLQIISFISRILAMLVGIFQSLIIVNILTTGEYGLIGLVTSMAGIAGIAQHLGLASSSTKEISGAKNDTEILHIAITSITIRYLISFPISMGLIFGAPLIANSISNQSVILPLQLFGVVLLVQALQSIFNSVIAGTQKFKILFTYQVLITFLSLVIYLPLVYFYREVGYFYALLAFNTIQTIVLGYLAFKDLKFKFSFPSKEDYQRIFKDLLSISLTIYFVKILVTFWQEFPVILLNQNFTLEMVAIFTFAFNFASKLMAVSDSITDVNLPVFSKKAHDQMDDFFKVFNHNFNILYLIIFILGMSITFWSKEILWSASFGIGLLSEIFGISSGSSIYDKYQSSVYLFFPLILSIVFYSYLNIFKSSIFIPLKILSKMIVVFVSLIVLSFSIYLLLPEKTLVGMSYSLAVGAFLAFVYSLIMIYQKYQSLVITNISIVVSILAVLIGILSYYNLSILVKSFIYVLFITTLLIVYEINPKEFLFNKILKRFQK